MPEERLSQIRIIGIDLSILSAGIAIRTIPAAEVLKAAVGRAINCTSCTVGTPRNPAQSTTQRLRDQAGRIIKLLKPTDKVVLEGYGISPFNPQISTIELGGLVKCGILARTGSEPLIVQPSQLKKFATGKGTSKKDEVRLAVYKRWKQDFQTHDEVDAYVLSEIGLAYWLQHHREGLNLAQQQVLHSLVVSSNPFSTQKKSKRKKKSA